MYLEVNATKTMREWYDQNPDFYAGLLATGEIDAATIQMIHRFFLRRIVCDDDNFTDFYMRSLLLNLPRYNKLIRLENTDFDALVSTYREHQTTNKQEYGDSRTGNRNTTGGSESNNESDTVRTPDLVSETTGNQSSEQTRTPDLTTTKSGSNSINNTTTTVSNGTSSSEGNTSGDAMAVNKQAPQSILYEENPVGQIPPLDWRYPSAQEQQHQDGESSMSGETHNDVTSTGEAKGSSNGSSHTTGNDKTVGSGESESKTTSTGKESTHTAGSSSTVTESSETSNDQLTGSRDSLTREVWTGRDGLTPQDALRTAMDYIRYSSAFVWLRYMIEDCFYGLYDI